MIDSFGFSGFRIIEVSVGTVIYDEKTRQSETVTETNYVVQGPKVYAAKDAFNKLKNHPDVVDRTSI